MKTCIGEEFNNPSQLGQRSLAHCCQAFYHPIKPAHLGFGSKIKKSRPLSMVTIDRSTCITFCRSSHKFSVPQIKCMNLSEVAQGLLTEMDVPKLSISISSYDTAWVAMVPSTTSPQDPCFPGCLEWILENQNPDGSWNSWNSPFLMKEALSSTLACILALVRWSTGNKQVERGIHFIQTNFSFAIDEQQSSPIGFNIIFPGMINYAKQLGLEIPAPEGILNKIFHLCNLELERGSKTNSKSWDAYLAYIAEGFCYNQDWEKVMKFQRKNGSLFNSPATTAAALIYTYNAKGLQYLRAALSKYGNAVTSVYPLDICMDLLMVDSLEKLGLDWYFRDHIRRTLSETYRSWLQNAEEIHSEILTRALAFRLLRMHGYDVSSDVYTQVVEDGFVETSLETTSLFSISLALELYKSSQLKISSFDNNMEKLCCLTRSFLEHVLANYASEDEISKTCINEVKYVLKFPFYANMERIEHKRNMEIYQVNNFLMLKSCVVFLSDSKDILNLAVKEFNTCQLIYQDELQLLERWLVESKLDKLKFARQKLAYCYFSAAATIFQREHSYARISWAKNSVLTTVIDDFFDLGGSQEEVSNFLELVERWDINHVKSSFSEPVCILFSALYTTVGVVGKLAYAFQGYDITMHLINIWKDLINSMKTEFEWKIGGTLPSMDDYMNNGCVSFALGPIVLPALYFMGPKLPVNIICEPECCNIFKLLSTCGRLLNDIQGFERERKEGSLNSMALLMSQSFGSTTEEAAKGELRDIVDRSRTELLRLVLSKEGSIIPQECKDLFWKMSRLLHFFYARTDGFSSPTEMMDSVNAVIFTPLKISPELLRTDLD